MTSVQRTQHERVTLTNNNVADVRALLETSPAITTQPWPVPNILGISVTITSPFGPSAAVVLEGDTVVVTDTEFQVVIEGGNTIRASLPRYAMSEHEARWVRDEAWTKKMRKAYESTPGYVRFCACQWGPTGHCKADNHTACQHTAAEPHRSPEAYVCASDGAGVLSFAEPYVHTTGSATGPKREQAAMVWLADRACRWRCPCDCHTRSPAAPEPPPATPSLRIDKPVQLDLFAALTT